MISPLATLRGTPGGPARRPQILAALSASIGALAIGSIIGYASPATYQLREADNSSVVPVTHDSRPFSFAFLPEDTQDVVIPSWFKLSRFSALALSEAKIPLTLNKVELSWFSSAFSIGALLGGIASSPALNLIGRRGTMMASALPALVGWMLIGFGRQFPLLVAGRVLTGLFTGLTCVSVNTYIGETASSDVRGILGSSFQFMFGSGIVYSYAFGSFMTWYNLAFLCAALPALFAILMFFNKESPTFLIAKGREEEAKEALQYLRGEHYDVTKELTALKKAHEEASRVKITFADLSRPSILRPLLIVLPLMAFQQLSGINALTFNLATIFKSAGSGMSEFLSSTLCAAVQALATLLAVLFIDTAGRRLLLTISAIIMGLSHGCVGLFFFLLDDDEEWTSTYLSWLPLLAVVCFMIAFSLGFGPIPWIMMGELFPPSVRETAGALATAVNWTISFLVIFSFEFLQEALNSYGFYWLFAVFCVVAAIFSVTVVMETKGKTLQEITAMFEDRGPLFSKPSARPTPSGSV